MTHHNQTKKLTTWFLKHAIQSWSHEKSNNLLCPNSHMPSRTIDGILHLENLSEVILHSSIQQAWETAMANGHPNRLCVKRQPEPTANIAA
jgi:hypothetical protein